MIFNGAHLTRATNAFAPPLFLPAPKLYTYLQPVLCPAPNHIYLYLHYYFLAPMGANDDFGSGIRYNDFIYTNYNMNL